MIRIEGVGLHTAEAVRVDLVPCPGPVELERDGARRPLAAFRVDATRRATDIACDAFAVRTVEHLFGAMAGMGIHAGCRVVVDSRSGELPLLDGSARPWVDVLERLDLPRTRPPLCVVRQGRIEVDGSVYELEPGATNVSVEVDLPPSCAPRASWDGEPATFGRIASAKTFALESDIAELERQGLARHVEPSSVLVVREDAIFGDHPVAPDEPARHKLLDLLGDTFLYGGPPRGVLRARRPGHSRNHAMLRRALAAGILAYGAVAHAEEPARTPLGFDLTHPRPEILAESTLASVTYNDAAVQGTTYVRVDRLAFEMPFSHWYVGAAYDTAIGHDDNGSPRFVPGNPELWGRGVWTATYGLSFGGGLALVIPTGSYSATDAAATTAFAAIAARGWDRALFDPENATLRPFLDVRLVTGPITVTYRQGLEVATDFTSTSFRLAAVGTVYFGVRLSPKLSAGVDLIEYYHLETGSPPLSDDQRGYFAVGGHIAIDLRDYRPSIGLMTNIGSPLNAISQVGSPITTAPTSFIGVHFSLDFPIGHGASTKKTP